MTSNSDQFLHDLLAELAKEGRQALPTLKGLYRAMISRNKGYWDPKARRTADDFGALSPTVLVRQDVIAKEHRSRFQTWFLQDAAPWPEKGDKKEARKLLAVMQADPRWDGAPGVAETPQPDRDRYFEALTALLHCKDEIQVDLARRAAGIYVVYRPSIVYPGRYVQGLMACFVDDATRALRTIEVHRMKREDASSTGGLAEGAGHAATLANITPELEDILLGCMVQKSRLIQIHSVDLMTRSFGLTYLQTALRGPAFPTEAPGSAVRDGARFAALDDERAMGFPSSEREGSLGADDLVSPFALLSGVASGTVGGSFFAFPCVYSRAADLPRDVPKKASGIFAYLRAEARYAAVLGVVETVPPFVLEQLKLRLPPTPPHLPEAHSQRGTTSNI